MGGGAVGGKMRVNKTRKSIIKIKKIENPSIKNIKNKN
jgi:hypothetical protein